MKILTRPTYRGPTPGRAGAPNREAMSCPAHLPAAGDWNCGSRAQQPQPTGAVGDGS